jgi:hypothetical protein
MYSLLVLGLAGLGFTQLVALVFPAPKNVAVSAEPVD